MKQEAPTSISRSSSQLIPQLIGSLQKKHLHLLILDIMLPEMSGVDFLKPVRTKSEIPVLILTALEDEQTQVKLFDELADDYLTKPFSLQSLQKIDEVKNMYIETGRMIVRDFQMNDVSDLHDIFGVPKIIDD